MRITVIILILPAFLILASIFPSCCGAKFTEEELKADFDIFRSTLREDDMTKIKEIIEKPGIVTAENQYHHTLLYWAVCYSHKEAVSMLIEMGADTKVKDSKGRTLLYHLMMQNVSGRTREGYLDVTEMLLDEGADPNLLYGIFPIMTLAIINNKTDLVKLLIEKGADPKIND